MANARDPEASKMRIIKEAEKQFAEKGLYAASVNVIAENAGINKRMIYHYYGSKEELYQEVLKVNFRKIYALGKQAFENREDIIGCAQQIIREYYYFLYNNPNYVKIMAWEEVSGGKYAREVIPDTLLVGYDKLKEVYQEGLDQGIFRPNVDLKQLIISINALCFITFARKEMMELLWQGDMEKKLEERLEHIYDLVLHGITSAGIREVDEDEDKNIQ